jgi:hypothetical protein
VAYHRHIRVGLLALILLLGVGWAQAQPALPKSGRFGAGLGVEALSLGPVEAVSAGGASAGLGMAVAVQVDLGARWALRVPVALDTTLGGGHGTFIDLTITPGLLYRWRHDVDQRWVPYAGAGLRLGAAGARRDLLGLPLVAAKLPVPHEHHADDPDFDTTGTIGPELWAGVEQHLNRWLALDWCLGYAWTRVDGVGVHLFRQTLGLRLTL